MASDEKPVQPIIVVKKKGAHAGAHGGAWKVAYADFVTAMMAFFLVMWLVTQSDAVKQAVAGYFNDPANYGKLQGTGILPGGPSPKVPDIKNDRQKELMLLRKAAQNIQNVMEENTDLANLRDQVEMTITSRGLRIQLVDKGDEKAFFEVGSAKLNPDAEKIIAIIGKELSKLPNDIVIEGHTDSRQYSGYEYTNWELSSERANAARIVLTRNGVSFGKIFSIEGYADRFLKIPANPMDARNRRVAILVLITSEASKYTAYEAGEQIR